MDNSFLIIEDLDDLILSYVDPPTVLALTQVNKHYNHILKDKQMQFNKIKFDAEIACKNS